MALSLYRKYRPNVFADVVGQEHVERTLVNAVTEGTVAHAYLFCGPRGTGKTTTARLLSKALLCEKSPAQEPDGSCEQCKAIADGVHPDVYELDAASRRGVDNVREEIISRVQFSPTRGRYKIYIIDEVHMLTTEAFNALLKTLEEPPEHVVFILCTTDPHKVPETIQSRCQRFDFRRLSIEEIVSYLERICKAEGFTYDREALEFIAAKSSGGMRDATTALEQVSVYTQGQVTADKTAGLFGQLGTSGLFEIAGLIAARDTASCFAWIDRLVASGVDFSQFARDLASHMRDLYVTALTGGANGIVSCPEAMLAQYQQQAREFGTLDRLSRALTVCGDLVNELRNSSDARLSVEIACTRLCRPESDLTLEALAERIAALEAGAPAAGAAPAVQPQGRVEPQAEAEPWGAVPAPQPAWKQQVQEANERKARQAESPEPQPARQSIPLAEAVQREKELEERDAMRAEDEAAAREAAAREAAARETAAREAAAREAAAREAVAREAADREAQAQREQQAQGQPAVTPSMSPARLLAAVLTYVKREDIATGALLNGVTIQNEGDKCYLSFPAGGEFAMKVASTGEARSLITRAFHEAAGVNVALDFRMDTRAAAVSQATPSYEPAPVDDGGYSSYDYEDGYEDDYPVYDEPAYEPSFDEPDFNDPMRTSAAPIDAETAANLSGALSAFGSGIKFQEVSSDE